LSTTWEVCFTLCQTFPFRLSTLPGLPIRAVVGAGVRVRFDVDFDILINILTVEALEKLPLISLISSHSACLGVVSISDLHDAGPEGEVFDTLSRQSKYL
jgi:hypothetical protein